MKPFQNPAAANVFTACPPAVRKKMLALRTPIFETAPVTDSVGKIEETLKRLEPACTTSKTKSGSAVRSD
ncbi:MAG: hypothetical protein LH632_07295 [Rhodoferax sp.]|nr:hypothetical protein [Rhodoferax sp.]